MIVIQGSTLFAELDENHFPVGEEVDGSARHVSSVHGPGKTINIIIIIIIIIITRPKLAYGRQGLAGSWGQDTDQAGTFWGVLNVSLCASGAQLG